MSWLLKDVENAGVTAQDDGVDFTFCTITSIMPYLAPLQQILPSLFLLHSSLQNVVCLQPGSITLYYLCIFNKSHNEFSTGLSSVIFGLSVFFGVPKLRLNYMTLQ